MSSIIIKLPTRKKRAVQVQQNSNVYLVSPGDIITEDTDHMRGHGESALLIKLGLVL